MSNFMQEVSTLESWVAARAEKSFQPSRYLNLFEKSLRQLMSGQRLDELPMNLTDAIQAAAEIEALCAHRSLQLYQQEARLKFEELIRETVAPRTWEHGKTRNPNRGPDGRFIEKPTPA